MRFVELYFESDFGKSVLSIVIIKKLVKDDIMHSNCKMIVNPQQIIWYIKTKLLYVFMSMGMSSRYLINKMLLHLDSEVK